jgi:hypothetical protein
MEHKKLTTVTNGFVILNTNSPALLAFKAKSPRPSMFDVSTFSGTRHLMRFGMSLSLYGVGLPLLQIWRRDKPSDIVISEDILRFGRAIKSPKQILDRCNS